MRITPIKTRVLVPPKDDLLSAIRESVRSLKEKSVLVITSKVVSIWQGRCIPAARVPDKDALMIREADKYLPRKYVPGAWCMHTIKNNIFIPSAGIDESNGKSHYILWPKNPKGTAKQLYDWARRTYRVKHIGVIITDSHTIPLRRGVLGISLAHYGVKPLKDYRGTKDLFGKTFTMSQTDIADGLAAAAVVAMGEGKEQTPLAVITDAPFVAFTPRASLSRRPFSSFEIRTKEDLYYPFLSRVPWERGGGGK